MLYLSRRSRYTVSNFGYSVVWPGTSCTDKLSAASLTRDLSNHITHLPDIDQQVTAVFYALVIDTLYLFGLSSIKISLFLWYHSLATKLKNPSRSLGWIIRGFLAVLGVFTITYAVIPFVACRPFHALWRQVDPGYAEPFQCINFMVSGLIAGVLDGVTDLSTCIVPLFIVGRQENGFQHKAGVAFVFLLGLVATATGIGRIFVIREFLDDDNDDWTWSRAMVNLTAMHHIHMALICACLPFVYQFIRPQLKQVKDKFCFRRGNNLHATRKLEENHPSYWSLHSKSPLPPKRSAFPTLRDSIAVKKLSKKKLPKTPTEKSSRRTPTPLNDLELAQPKESDKKAGKRKGTPPTLNLDSTLRRQPSRETTDTASQFEITVVYTPSRPQTHAPEMRSPTFPPDTPSLPNTHVPEMQSPTLPPDFLIKRNRLSNYSWMTSRSKQSTWSSLRSSITARSPDLGRKGSTARSPGFPPYSPGLSTIDLGELPDIHALPSIPPPRRGSARLPCRGCGKFHPPGYRHTDAEVERNVRGFALWRSSRTTHTTTRHSQSTFYNEEDEEEEDEAVLRQGQIRRAVLMGQMGRPGWGA